MDKINLDEFKASYYTSSREDQEELIQSVHGYPNRFDREVQDYVEFIWSPLSEIYSLRVLDGLDEYKEVLGDLRYSKRVYNHAARLAPYGFKIYDSNGTEVAQGIFTYQKDLKIVDIYYIEFLEVQKVSTYKLMNHLFKSEYSENIVVRFNL